MVGAGPAGLLAAIIMARQGVSVECVDGRDPGAGDAVAQAAHVHILPPDLPESLGHCAADLAPALSSAVDDGWTLRVDDAGPEPWAYLPREAFQDRLRGVARAFGVTLRGKARVTGLEAVSGGVEVVTARGRVPADVVVDASGASRCTARRAAALGLPLGLDEIGARMHYASLAGALPNGIAARQALIRNGGDGRRALFLAKADGQFHLTFQSDQPIGLRGADVPDWFEVHGAPGLAAELRTVLEDGGHEPIRYVAPPIRRLAVAPPQRKVPWFAFGDALLQTPPRFAFGIAAIARQGAVLADAIGPALERDDPAEAIRAALEAESAALWGQTALASL